MFKDYYDCRAWLESFIPYTYSKENLGLERIGYLLELLRNPQNKFKSIHVAGTSGKGSTAFYISTLLEFAGPVTTFSPPSARSSKRSANTEKWAELRAARMPSTRVTRKHSTLKVGLHLSPHLSYIGERMQIDGKLISVKRLVMLVNEIKPIVESMKDSKVGMPSYFEILVAASFKYFAQEKVDWAIVETGLGGRLDATNVLKPEISVITNVGFDHTEILGKTIEKIAFEKAGIIKHQTAVVTGADGKALEVIKKVARLASASLIKVDDNFYGEPRRTKDKKAELIKLNTRHPGELPKSVSKDYLIIYRDIERHILNSFAPASFLLALTTVLALGFKPSEEAVLQTIGLGFEGRFELIDKNVILDSAHNADKVKYLLKMINNHTNYSNNQSKVILVVGFKKGKDWKKMLDLLIKNLPVKKVVATKFYQVTDTGRFAAVEPKEVINYVNGKWKMVNGKSFDNSQEAVYEAINLTSKKLKTNQQVLVTGSLYLVGEVRTVWNLPTF